MRRALNIPSSLVIQIKQVMVVLYGQPWGIHIVGFFYDAKPVFWD